MTTVDVTEAPAAKPLTSRAVNRPARKPLIDGGKMKVPQIPGYYTRFINTDEHNHAYRLQSCIENWYEPVSRKEVFGPDCANPNAPVVIPDANKPMLVKLPLDVREDDMKRRHHSNDALYRTQLAKRDDGQYGAITVSDSVKTR